MNVPHEQIVIESLLGKKQMESIARQYPNEDERLRAITEAILRGMSQMNPKTLASIVAFLSSKHRGCLTELREIAIRYAAKEHLSNLDEKPQK